jgi:hypothetical protein
MSSDNMSTRDVARTLKNAAREGAIEGKAATDDRAIAMFAPDESEGYRTQWDGIQTGFVDEPRRAVEEADALVAQVITRLSEVFADERTRLEQQWGHTDQAHQVNTEDLRLALRKYRSFFERLLSL